jgi:AhpD family alkylhydroperoxidase
MSKSYKEIYAEGSKALGAMGMHMKDVMGAFQTLHAAAVQDGVLSKKTKELIALALAVGSRCDNCIAFHMKALVQLGATRQEIVETLGMAILMGGGPSVMCAADALKALDELSAT